MLLLAPIMVMVPDAARADYTMVIGEGETLVIVEDTDWSLYYLAIEGTLVVDGANLQTRFSTSHLVEETYINLSGTLRVINGGRFDGMFTVNVLPGGVVDVSDSTVSGGSTSGYTFDLHQANISIVSSTITTYSFINARGSNVTLRGSDVLIRNNWYDTPTINISEGANLVLDGTSIQGQHDDRPLLDCSAAGNISVSGSDLWTPTEDLMRVDGAASLLIEGTSFRQGGNGLRVNDVANVTMSRVTMNWQSGWACNLSWLGSLDVRGLTIEDCEEVALNVTNSTDVSLADVDITGVGGKGIGVLTQYCQPLTARGVTVRYAQKGVYMIYTDDVTMEDVAVDWCRRYGLQASYCDDVTIEGISATGCGVDGLYVAFSQNVRVTDGTLDSAEECGAFLTHSPVSLTNVSARKCGAYGVRAATHSTFLVRCDLSYNGLDGLFSLDQGGVGLSDCIIEGNGGNGTRFLNARAPWIKGSRIADNGDAGIRVHYGTHGAEVQDCDIEGNRIGVVLNGPTNMSSGSSVMVRNSYIHNSTEAGAFNYLSNTSNLDARYCWWGNNTGPSNETENPMGTGDAVVGGVKFRPWLRVGNIRPVISGPRDIVVEEETFAQHYYSAMDWDNDPNLIEFGLEDAPGNVTIEPVSGALRVSPDDPEVGIWHFFVTATDDDGGVGRLRVNLTVTPVNDPPVIVVPGEGIKVGDDNPFAVTLRAVDPDDLPTELTWILISGPDWCRLHTSGTLTGNTTWQVRGDHQLTVRVEDDDGGLDEATIHLIVVPHYDPISIDGLSRTEAYEDVPFSAEVRVSHDPEAVLEWEMITNASWLRLDAANGTLVGTPLQEHAGTASVQLTVRDQLGMEVTEEMTIRVFPVNDPPVWVDLPVTVVVNSTHLTLDLSKHAQDPDDPLERLDYRLDGDQPRLSIRGSVLTIELRRSDTDRQVTIVVEDPHGAWAAGNLTLQVRIPAEPEPSLTVADLFPWLLVAVFTAVAAVISYTYLDRRGRAGEGA